MTSAILKDLEAKTEKMPTMFFGHGSPLNAVKKNDFTDFLSKASLLAPKPKAILAISAHWETRGTKVMSLETPKTIHDFGGFPESLYKIQYPAKGDVKLADSIVDLMKAHQVEADSK